MPTVAGSIVSRFDYDAAADDEVAFRVGEIGTILNKVSDDWWLVQFGSRSGLIPSNYVSEVLAEAVAEFDYSAQDETEVNFNDGDTILVLEKLDADWWIGQVKDMQGMFPSAYVKEVPLVQPGQAMKAAPAPSPAVAQPAPKAAAPGSNPSQGKNMQMPAPPAMPMAPPAMPMEMESSPPASPQASADVVSYQGMGAIQLPSAAGVVLKKTEKKNKNAEPAPAPVAEPAPNMRMNPKANAEPKMPSMAPVPMPMAPAPAAAAPTGRVSVANQLESMKNARMAMMQTEVAMVQDLERQLAEAKETLHEKDEQLATWKAKMEKMEKEWTAKLDAAEQHKRDWERKFSALEMEHAKLQKELNMISSEESNKVVSLKSEVQTQFEKIKELQDCVHTKDDQLMKMQMDQERMMKSMNGQIHDLEKQLHEKDAAMEKLRSEQSNSGKSLAEGIWASGELCLNINGTNVLFTVAQAGAVVPMEMSMAAPAPMPAPVAPMAPAVVEAKPPKMEKMPSVKNMPKAMVPHDDEETKEWSAPPEPEAEPEPVPIKVEPKKAPAAAPAGEMKPGPAVAKKGAPAPMAKAKVASKPAPSMPSKMADSAPVIAPAAGGAPQPRPRKASYADKLKASDGSSPAPALVKACDQCTPEQCSAFTPNQFKAHLCGTCRHNKSAHPGAQ